ncbi:N-acetyltransferase GCN5 [Methylophaga lonarensis MPL]|uniref:N-acetyltransferase GCN5 n=1 Tax=Methylophaga lonarensis MPL TaxID=1286106 RepID=M7PJ05_9GAMM|nr:GNAT family N-acetyltransferase [Methylophaga lonarensis]EMR13860.1 N-acetyltransferase GCN5 [Methylophaga lonarensis MPL]
MKLDFNWSRLESLTVLNLYQIIKARESVFVVEQQCPYQETDDLDLHAWHLTVSVAGELAAYARVIAPGTKGGQPSIGRVMTVKKFRGKQIGRALMHEAIRFTEQTFPDTDIKISAQVYLQTFYESLGFYVASSPYDEDGIAHIDMIKQVKDLP